MRLHLTACGTLLAILIGCGSDGTSTPTGNGLKLEALDSQWAFPILQVFPKPGNRYVKVRVSLANQAAKQAAPLSPAQFSVIGADGQIFGFTPLTTKLTDGCNPAVLLAVGDTATCWVMFEVASTATIAAVRYLALDSTVTKAPLNGEPKGVMACEANATTNCGSCQNDHCKAEADAYLAVDKKCTNLNAPPCTAIPRCDCLRQRLLDQTLCPPIFDALELCMGTNCMTECGYTQ